MTTKYLDTTASTVVGTAAMLGGLAWLLLIPAAELHRRELLSYDGYNRLLAIPLLLFLVALLAVSRALTVAGRSVRAGLLAAAVGVGLLLAGNVAEFYGVLLQDQPNAYAAAQAGEASHWVGSDVGWIVFGVGVLVLLVGGLTAAAGMLRHRVRPTWWSPSSPLWASASWLPTCLRSDRRCSAFPCWVSTPPDGSPSVCSRAGAASDDRPSVPRLEGQQRRHRHAPIKSPS